ncbi:MAG: type IX secretion system outer membrane channel protein PorV [Balneolaceae bacterium]|nr:type IX secretion system outer membrane channel protein PorV [Balneolaceae bacterium]MBO6546985.1 type IX secretion system outer membrane channel protein PorV [Balneolaceae bacterium]MBO6649345.1 type IX secretion system outer membrane channel protein PorV [Balneolaceae bacterium]
MKKVFLLAIALALFVFPSVSNAQVAITAVPFLQIEPDSRGAAMGNTGVAIADNAAAMFWNPAGLAFQTDNQISITHSNWLANFNVSDLFYDYLVGKYYVEGIGTIGAHLTYLNLGEQARTGEQSADVISKFNSYELAFGLSYGFEVNKNLALGTSLRLIYSSLATGTTVSQQRVNPGSSVAVDLAMLYKSNPFMIGGNEARFSGGFNLSNVGPGMQYTDNAQKDPLPTLLRFGVAFDYNLDPEGFNRITIASDVTKIMARKKEVIRTQAGVSDTMFVASGPIEALFDSWGTFTRNNGQEIVELGLIQQFMIGAGAEYWYNNLFALRGGYYYEDPENGDRKYITFGAGLRYNSFGIDFSYIKTLESDHPLANTLRFSVLLNF